MRPTKFHLRQRLLIAVLTLLAATSAQADETFTMNPIGHVSKQRDTTTIVIDPRCGSP